MFINYCQNCSLAKVIDFRWTGVYENSLRITDLDYDRRYRFVVYGTTNAGKGDPNSRDARTLPEFVNMNCKFFFISGSFPYKSL